MIFQLLTGGSINFTAVVGLLIAWVFGVSVHEFSHALAATWLGDSLPRRQGRLTLQPAAHLDVVGSLMFLIGGFGWGKPVQYNPYALRASPRTGPAIVAAAGPLSNLIFATLLAIPVRLVPILIDNDVLPLQPGEILYQLLLYVMYFNLVLAFFNLIPVFPLDGFSILNGLLPAELAERFQLTQQYGFFILMLLLIVGNSIMEPLLYRPIETVLGLLIGR
ncbi:MAG: site-2 protease family protein [Chloroflexi bacterium]|nr:site-2 protease family protein [Chloroflexota bacterium]